MDIKTSLERKQIKCILVDFDDTMFGWTDVVDYEESSYAEDALNGINWYDNHEGRYVPIDFIQKFLKMYRDDVEKIICVSWCDWSEPFQMKNECVQKHYGSLVDKCIFTGTREGKVDLLRKLCMTYDWDPEEILMIDDHPQTCRELRSMDCLTISPIGIYAYMLRENLLNT